MSLIFVLFALPAQAGGPCAFPMLQASLVALPRPRLLAAPPAAGKATRDAFGEFPHSEISANFVMKWGDDVRVDEADVQSALAALEYAWGVEVDELGHPSPATTESYLLNVYVGDSDPLAPVSYGAAGYYYRDPEGFPFLMLAPATLGSSYESTTAAHEFYHAIQDGTAAYTYSGDDAWFWEASAMWIEGEVYPSDPDYFGFLFGQALLPHLSLAYFDYPDTGALGEYHQYGAMIFPRYLSEVLGDWTIVRDAWTDPGNARSPMEGLTQGLAARGFDPDREFFRFAAHNAAFDYADGVEMERVVGGQERAFSGETERFVGTVSGVTVGVLEAPVETLPQAFGYGVLGWNHASSGRFVVNAVGEATGDAGTEAIWGFTLVRERADGPLYEEIGGATGGELTVDVSTEDGSAWLVAAVTVPDGGGGDTGLALERFAWSYSIAEGEPDEVGDSGEVGEDPAGGGEEGPTNACGCEAVGGQGRLGAGVWAGWLAVGLAWRTRRRVGEDT